MQRRKISQRGAKDLTAGAGIRFIAVFFAPVFQWIEFWPPKPAIRVRISAGAPFLKKPMFASLKKIFSSARFRLLRKWILRLYIAGTLTAIAVFLLVSRTRFGIELYDYQTESTPFAELPDDADAVVILGGDEVRAIDAAKIFNAGKAKRVVVSADETANLDALFAAKIPRERISVDPAALRTADHPYTIQAYGISPESRIIITSTLMQERRAARLFRDAGYKNFWIYSSSREIRLPELRERGYIGTCNAVHAIYAHLAWLKYWLFDAGKSGEN